MTNDPGLTDNEARENAGIHLEANYWKRCNELRQAGAIKNTGREREGAFGHDRMVCEITPYGIRKVEEELWVIGSMKLPRPKPSARNSDPDTSHAAAASPERRSSAEAQVARLLVEYHRTYRAWEASLS